jgi:hypothetical protein
MAAWQANITEEQIDETLHGAWMRKLQLVVRTLGKVYEGDSEREARRRYRLFVKGSKESCGRSTGQSVTLFKDWMVMREYLPSRESQEFSRSTRRLKIVL